MVLVSLLFGFREREREKITKKMIPFESHRRRICSSWDDDIKLLSFFPFFFRYRHIRGVGGGGRIDIMEAVDAYDAIIFSSHAKKGRPAAVLIMFGGGGGESPANKTFQFLYWKFCNSVSIMTTAMGVGTKPPLSGENLFLFFFREEIYCATMRRQHMDKQMRRTAFFSPFFNRFCVHLLWIRNDEGAPSIKRQSSTGGGIDGAVDQIVWMVLLQVDAAQTCNPANQYQLKPAVKASQLLSIHHSAEA